MDGTWAAIARNLAWRVVCLLSVCITQSTLRMSARRDYRVRLSGSGQCKGAQSADRSASGPRFFSVHVSMWLLIIAVDSRFAIGRIGSSEFTFTHHALAESRHHTESKVRGWE